MNFLSYSETAILRLEVIKMLDAFHGNTKKKPLSGRLKLALRDYEALTISTTDFRNNSLARIYWESSFHSFAESKVKRSEKSSEESKKI